MDPETQKQKKKLWDDSHTLALISALNEVKVNELLDSKRFRKGEIYNRVKMDMEKQGVFKTANQIDVKYRALKSGFYAAKNALQVSGAAADVTHKSPYYHQLIPIFGTTPKANYSSIDSSGTSDKVVKKEVPAQRIDVKSEEKASTFKASISKENSLDSDEDVENENPTAIIKSKKMISVKTQRTRTVNQQMMLEKLTTSIQGKQEDLLRQMHKEQQESDRTMMEHMADIMTRQTLMMMQGLREIHNFPNVNGTQPSTPYSSSQFPSREYTMPSQMTKQMKTREEPNALLTSSLSQENLKIPTLQVPGSPSALDDTNGIDRKRQFLESNIPNKKMKFSQDVADINSSLNQDELRSGESSPPELLPRVKSIISCGVIPLRQNQTEQKIILDRRTDQGKHDLRSMSATAEKWYNTACSSTSSSVTNPAYHMPDLGITPAEPIIQTVPRKVSFSTNPCPSIQIGDGFDVKMVMNSGGDELEKILIEEQQNEPLYEVVRVDDSLDQDIFDINKYIVFAPHNSK